MELGTARLRSKSPNLLFNAIHARHGLVWTDGNAIYLTPVQVTRGRLNAAESCKLGEFELVKGVCWSCDVGPSSCFLCVAHMKNISVWKVDGSGPNLSFKQVRKINVQTITQGCLWNPKRDLLCLLSREKCTFYFHHDTDKLSYAFPALESGRITCGAWSPDGTQLVVCVGSVVLVYFWADIDSSITEVIPTAWRVPELDGGIGSVVFLSSTVFACGAELPLESLCKVKDTFVMPDISPGVNRDARTNSFDSGIILPKDDFQSSHKDRLFNLKDNPQVPTQGASQLLIIQLGEDFNDPMKLAVANVYGLLTPDILHYEESSQMIIVGGSTQSVLNVFHFTGLELKPTNYITLHKSERPKGISSIMTSMEADVIIMIGKAEATNNTFLPPSPESTYHLSIGLFPIQGHSNMNGNDSLSAAAKDSSSAFSSLSRLLPKEAMDNDNEIHTSPPSSSSVRNDSLFDVSRDSPGVNRNESAANIPCGKSTQKLYNSRHWTGTHANGANEDLQLNSLVLPNSIAIGSEDNAQRKLIVDVTDEDIDQNAVQEYVSISSTVPEVDISSSDSVTTADENLIKYEQHSVKRRDSNNLEKDISNEQSLHSINIQDETECVKCDYDFIKAQCDTQGDQIKRLHDRILDLSKKVEETTCVFPTKYQAIDKPTLVRIVCRCRDKSTEQKTFLLDDGRLKLDVLKEAFGLVSVELLIEGLPCVLGANIDGYIPLRFIPSSTYFIGGTSRCVPDLPYKGAYDSDEELTRDPVTGATRC